MTGIAMIIIIILLVLSVTWVSLVEDKNKRIALGLIAILAILLFIIVHGNLSYKNGQIDALSGKVKYELQTQQDSTRIWVEKEEK